MTRISFFPIIILLGIAFPFLPLNLAAQLNHGHPFTYKQKMGMVDAKGNILVEPQYDRIYRFASGNLYTIFETEGKNGVMDDKGRIVITPVDNKIKIHGHYATYYDNNQYLLGLHLFDLATGKEIITDDSLRFKEALYTTSPFLILLSPDSKRKFLYNANGDLITSYNGEMDQIVFAHKTCPLFSARSDNPDDIAKYKSRYFDCTGTDITKEAYAAKYGMGTDVLDKSISRSSEQKRIAYNKAQETEAKDPLRHPLINEFRAKFPEYECATIIEQNNYVIALIVRKSFNNYALIDPGGIIIIPFEYEDLAFQSGYLQTRLGAKRGVMNLDGRQILPLKFLQIDYYPNSDGMFYDFEVTTHNGYRGYALKTGEIFLPPEALNY